MMAKWSWTPTVVGSDGCRLRTNCGLSRGQILWDEIAPKEGRESGK